MAFEQMSALGQRFVKIKTGHAAGRADARLDAQGVFGDEHDRAMVFFCQPTCHDADDARVPLVAGEHQGGRIPQIAEGFDLL